MKRKLMTVLTLVLGVTLAVSLGYILWRDMDRAAGNEVYDEALELAGVPDLVTPATGEPTPAPVPTATPDSTGEPTPTPDPTPEPTVDPEAFFRTLHNINLSALQEHNPEVLGWIAIPNTLSYPLLQGTDNDYYLTHTWKGTASAVGAIFMDYRCDSALGDANTLIYGHRTQGGAMFGNLRKYASYAYWEANPDVYLVTEEGISRYRIYAAYEAEVTSLTYQKSFSDEEQWQAFIDHGTGKSVITTGTQPGPEDQVITLSTCTAQGSQNTRWVVQAVYEGQEP